MISLSDTTPDAVIYYTTNGSSPQPARHSILGRSPSHPLRPFKPLATGPALTPAPWLRRPTGSHPGGHTGVLAGPIDLYRGPYSRHHGHDAWRGDLLHHQRHHPTAKSTRYTAPIAITTSETLQAIAVAPNYANSAVATGVYNLVTATPYFSPTPGTYTSAQTVGIQDDTPNSKITTPRTAPRPPPLRRCMATSQCKRQPPLKP